jgi:hypothetical protein
MGKSRARGAMSASSAGRPSKGTGFTSGPKKHATGKTLGGGVEFEKRRLRVGKRVAKHASATDTTIRSKSIRLAAQNIHTVEGVKRGVGVSDKGGERKGGERARDAVAEL